MSEIREEEEIVLELFSFPTWFGMAFGCRAVQQLHQ